MRLLDQHVDAIELPARLRDADALTTELLSDVIATACRRFPSLGQPENTTRIERQSSACTSLSHGAELLEPTTLAEPTLL